MNPRGSALTLSLMILSSVLIVTGQQNKSTKAQQEAKEKEESGNYFKKWAQEEVSYIIQAEEEDAFKRLKTDEEREQFIEAFWLRRDTNPDTSENEYREDYYRRIVQANEKFTLGDSRMEVRSRPDLRHARPAGRSANARHGRNLCA
jgi:hypothetical protein